MTEMEGYGTSPVKSGADLISCRRQKALIFLASATALLATVAVFGGADVRYALEETDVTAADDTSKFRDDAKKALDLEMSKAKYDAAKDRVKNLHEQFIDLEKKLGKEVTNLDYARGQLVSQIQGIEGKNAIPATAITSNDYASMPPLQKVVAAVSANLDPTQHAIVYDPSAISKPDGKQKNVVAAVSATLDPAQGAVVFTPSDSTDAALIKSDAIVHVAAAAASAKASHLAADASQKSQQDADAASKQSQSAASASRAAAKAAMVHVVSAAVSAKASNDAATAAQAALKTAADASEHAIEAAKDSRNAADASQASLTYTQGVASKVGALVGEAESEAARIAAAGKVTDEAKSAMQAALEQSSQIVDYNTHAAQAVAQDAGFVSAAAKTVSSFLENIFKDTRAVRKAAKSAQKKIKRTVAKFAAKAQASADKAKQSATKAAQEESRAKSADTAADDALKTALSKADDAERVDTRIQKAELEVAQLASHAGLAARVASDAAAGAAQGEKIAMQASYEARSRLNDVYSAARGAWVPGHARPAWGAAPAVVAPAPQPVFRADPWSAASAAVGSAVATGAAPVYRSPAAAAWAAAPAVVSAAHTAPVFGAPTPLSPYYAGPAGGVFPVAVNAEANLQSAKMLVDTVVVLMRQLTRSLEGALMEGLGRCRRVRELLAWYQAQMAEYHVRGLSLAHTLSEDDMELVEEYAQAQVATFSAELEQVVADASSVCSLSTSAFLPDVPASSLPQPAPLAVPQPLVFGDPLSFSGLAQKHDVLVAHAKENVAQLKKELLAAERIEQQSASADASDPADAQAAAASAEASKIDAEKAEVEKLKEQVAQLMLKRSMQAKA